MNHGAHVIIDRDEFIDAGTAAIAIARIAVRPIQLHGATVGIEIQQAALIFAGREFFAIRRIQYPHQALGHHADQAG